tara:strand:- start:2317 stop:2874 length:558 start_codon:yes stop_codon:yes gene_type:complete
MASVTEIANMALLRVGAEPILSLTEDNGRARACNIAWPFARQHVLRSHSWNCATVRATLSPLTDAPTWEFATAYTVPPDSLHVMEVDTTTDWRVENGKILTDATGALNIRYIKDETETGLYDASLSMVMALRLAVEIAEKLTNNAVKREFLLQEYLQAVNDAMVDDGEEQSPADMQEDSWVSVRS